VEISHLQKPIQYKPIQMKHLQLTNRIFILFFCLEAIWHWNVLFLKSF